MRKATTLKNAMMLMINLLGFLVKPFIFCKNLIYFKTKSIIIGDFGYPLEPWLMTPYRVAPEGSAECTFNDCLSKGRNIIERLN